MEALDIQRDENGVLRCVRCKKDVESSIDEMFGHMCPSTIAD